MTVRHAIDYVIEFLVGKELVSSFVWHDSGWFKNPRMPDSPVREFEGMPVLFWKGDKPDFVASAYFLLSRYEELLNPARDEHGRFPGKASIPFKAGFIDRPIVDEYSRYLKQNLGVIVSAEKRIAKLWLTHDVDLPFEKRGLRGRLRDVASILKRRHRLTLRPVLDYLNGRSNPDCFDWILEFDQSIQKRNSGSLDVMKFGAEDAASPTLQTSNPPTIQSVYFILARKNGTSRDNWYLEDPRWPDLLKRFHQYGVFLGLHTSYAAGGDMSTVQQDVTTLSEHLNIQKSKVPIFNRHHFLRMTDPSDFKYLEVAGITDDFSVGYADVAGFRVGTCRPYRWIDPRTGMVGKLVIHPMTIMECTLDGANYMGLTESEARDYSNKLIDRVAEFGGECVLLWHNNSLISRVSNWQRRLYCDCASRAQDLI